MRHWIAVASPEHIETAVAGSFIQLGHGKEKPVRRLRHQDWLVLYATSISAFAAVGQVGDGDVFQVEQDNQFCPYRRGVHYLPDTESVKIRSLLDELSFTKDKGKNWGMVLRRGFFEIDAPDFRLIYEAMQARE